MQGFRLPLALWLCLLNGAAFADDSSIHGYLDLRSVSASRELSWTRGGPGKTRFGGNDIALRFGGAALVGTTQLNPSLMVMADVQFQSTGSPTLSLVAA